MKELIAAGCLWSSMEDRECQVWERDVGYDGDTVRGEMREIAYYHTELDLIHPALYTSSSSTVVMLTL